MKYPLLIEGALNLIKDKISSGFNATLQEIDNQYDDGISLEPISENAIYISDQIQSVQLPAVFILTGTSTFKYDTDPNYLNLEDEFVIVVSCEDIGAETIQKKLFRYQRILIELLNLEKLETSDGRLKLQCIPTQFGKTQPIVTKLKDGSQSFRGDAVMEMKVLHYEKNLT